MREAIEKISTAAAETSLATFASLDILGLAISTTASIAVLINSKQTTPTIVRIKTSHSEVDIFR